jgi:two-component system sensor histidine kinase QseC
MRSVRRWIPGTHGDETDSVSLERRLLLWLLLCAPLVWLLGLALAMNRAQQEVNELFDTEMIRLARQVQAVQQRSGAQGVGSSAAAASAASPGDQGQADLEDLAIAVWDRSGRLQLADREGVMLPREVDASGFRDLTLAGAAWRVYYLQAFDGESLVAAGQRADERDEVVLKLSLGQLLPWVLMLPLLLVVMAWAVRRALAPVHQLTGELRRRSADALHPMPEAQAPTELRPMVSAMNGLFLRIEQTLARERRFTADAAHELRTPLAVLRAQWDVLRRARSGAERAEAEARLAAGLDRIDRLVTQMLALSRLEGAVLAQPLPEVDWQPVVEQALNDCLPLAERRGIEFECVWPPAGTRALPLPGDADLLTVMLRNLLDNAARYAPPGSTVQLRFGPDGLQVVNDGPVIDSALLTRLGERYFRPDGQDEGGSGLGLSIVQRVAALHGLDMTLAPSTAGRGLVVGLARSRRPEP